MKLGKKVILWLACAALLVVLLSQGYVFLHFRLFQDYKNLLTVYPDAPEAGSPFAPLPDKGGGVEGMRLAAENELLKLYADPAAGNIAVYDKRSGKITRSNPVEAADDPLANGQNKAMLQSQIAVEFFNTSRLQGTYNSFSYATEKDGQISAESLENGVRITYTLGDVTSKTGIVPVYITEERLESFLAVLDETKARYVRTRYRESAAAPGFMELNESARTGAGQLRNLTAHFTEAGYTEDDYNADMAASNVEGAAPISFVVPVEYRLDGDSLTVTIPASGLRENGGGMIYRIQLLRFFGAGGTDEEGYIMVPNATGSLIHFNNGKTYAEDYVQYLYGMDPLLSDFLVLGNTTDAQMPYFGLHREGQTMLATILDGDSLTFLTATVSGKLNSYNSVYPTFVLRGASALRMFGATGNEADLPVVEKDLAATDLCVRYSFLDEAHRGYTGMANYAREQLLTQGLLTAKTGGGDIPLFLDVLGAARGTKFFLGAQYEGIVPMTTYDQAAGIVADLQSMGITNQSINFQGWFNRGYYHDAIDKIRLVGSLGSKKELEALSALLEDGGGKLYMDAALQGVTFSTKHFNYAQETSRYYAGGYAALGIVHPTTLRRTASLGYRDVLHDLLSPKFLSRYADALLEGMERYDVTGISLRDLGSMLHSDRKRTEVIGREEALDITLAQLDKFTASEKAILTASPNLYAAVRSDEIINLPLAHNSFYIVDEEIPFYQMLLHGHVSYAGAPINLSNSGDEQDLLLRLMEFGASPHFTISYEETGEMKYTSLFHRYSTTYENWRGMAQRLYTELNGVLRPVSDAQMNHHEVFENGLRCVGYDNGTFIYINHTEETLTAEGVTVPPRSYGVREGGGV